MKMFEPHRQEDVVVGARDRTAVIRNKDFPWGLSDVSVADAERRDLSVRLQAHRRRFFRDRQAMLVRELGEAWRNCRRGAWACLLLMEEPHDRVAEVVIGVVLMSRVT